MKGKTTHASAGGGSSSGTEATSQRNTTFRQWKQNTGLLEKRSSTLQNIQPLGKACDELEKWINNMATPQVLASCWVDIKAKLPIKLAGIKIRDMLLRPVDLDYSMVATIVRLLRELELGLADQRGTRPTRHFVVPEWLVRTL
ncbi:uncharacterized protein LOC120650856 isoform X2 [Panicum virgatum]|uniref:uncharacterized protein LOC120650856 isoform X2 n=1 Tax=Panicum virgatum TaxID=38727 RepID=UPI0019D5ED21|nr:uncharacterized protein LOC120650856 isoform X2 [Panicum virgatum]